MLNSYLQQIELLRLESFLASQPEPVYESILLGEFCPQLNQINGPAIELYRWHFALFHQLYRLKDRLVASNSYLHIHFMGIHLTAYPGAGECRYYEDSRFCRAEINEDDESLCAFHRGKCEESALNELSDRYFYLDPENFFALKEENAEAFISGAWNLLVNYDEVQACYKTLGLP
ncbi:MAG: DNA-J related domain-containing protein, partial [Candidatus Rifleibacteriota bacterium]